jgi:hypothetical protein
MTHRCPHSNRNCVPGNLCTPCAGGSVLKDGEQVITRMLFLDSVQNAIATRFTDTGDAIRAQARTDHEEWLRGQPQANEAPRGFDDSAELAQHFADKAASNARLIADAAANAARVQAHVDYHLAEAAKRDHALTRNGYSKSFEG